MSALPDKTARVSRLTPARVALLYAVFSSLWIIASGVLLTLTVDDEALQHQIEVGKGLLFVLVTTGLLYLLLRLGGSPVADETLPPGTVAIKRSWRRGLASLAVILVVPLAGYMVTQVHGPQVEREAMENLSAIADLQTRQIENWLDERRGDGGVLMADARFIENVQALAEEGSAEARELVRHRLMPFVDAVQYDAALVVNESGEVLSQIGHPFPVSVHVRELIPVARQSWQTLAAEIEVDDAGEKMLDFVVPLVRFEPDGKKTAVGSVVLRVRVDASMMINIRHWPTASKSGETILIRRDGDALLMLGSSRDSLSSREIRRLPVSGRDAANLALITQSRSGVVRDHDADGKPVFAAFRQVAGTAWVLVARVNQDEILAPVRALSFWVSLVAFVALSVIGAMMFLLLRQRERALRLEMAAQSDRILRRFYDLPFIGIAICAPDNYRLLQCNDRLGEIFGASRQAMIDTEWARWLSDDVRQETRKEFARIATGQDEAFTTDMRFGRSDGTVIDASMVVRCTRKPDGEVEYLIATLQDVTDARRAADSIQRLTGVYAALSECNQAIVQCRTSEALFADVCRIAITYGGIEMAWVGVVDAATQRVIPVAKCGGPKGFLDRHSISVNSEHPGGRFPTSRAIRERQPCWVQDTFEDPLMAPWLEASRESGFRAVAALPLLRDGEALGAFVLYSRVPGFFDDTVRVLLTKMAQAMGLALERFAHEDERHRMETALRESEGRFRDLYEKAPLPYLLLDAEGRIVDANGAWLALFEQTLADVSGNYVGDFLVDESAQALAAQLPVIAQYERTDGIVLTFHHPDGAQRLLMLNAQASHDRDGGLRIHCILTDLTERQKSAEQLRLAAAVFEQSAEGIVITDLARRIQMVNNAFTRITGYSEKELVGSSLRLLSDSTNENAFEQAVREALDAQGFWHGEVWRRRKNGEIFPAQGSISRVLDANRHVTHLVGIFSDVSERKSAEEKIHRLAHFDALTGLPNRSLLEDRVGQALSRVARFGSSLALIFLDLDRFKNINDSLGHRVGDKLLIQVAERLKQALRDEDTVSRLGGDEFILVLPDTDDHGATHVAEKVLSELAQPYTIEQHELIVTPSLGIALYPSDGHDYETLSRCADTAMYRAKQSGRNTFRFFTREMQERSERTLLLENALRRVFDGNQLSLRYQPQMSLSDGRLVGVEALLRWQHPELGEVPPGDFVPISEENGLILPIGEWVLRQAVGQMRAWLDAGMPPLVMAVNLSAVQFHQSNLTELVKRVLAESGLPPECLELELTEGVAMDNPLAAIAVMDELAGYGVKMSIDDFGTGYSSLNYLKRFRVSKLKIDQSFVRDCCTDPEDAAIIETIIGLARNLGLKAIAEGVESAEQLAFLRDRDCDEVQGYLIGRPMAAEAFEVFVRSGAGDFSGRQPS